MEFERFIMKSIGFLPKLLFHSSNKINFILFHLYLKIMMN